MARLAEALSPVVLWGMRMATKEQMRQLLLRLYNDHGPREGKGKIVPPEKFARMTDAQVNRWDFDDRFIMHEIAKTITRP